MVSYPASFPRPLVVWAGYAPFRVLSIFQAPLVSVWKSAVSEVAAAVTNLRQSAGCAG
jgi:hypothetical protein